MNLISTIGSRRWENANFEDLILAELRECESADQERITISNMLAGLVKALPLTNEQRLEVLNVWQWSVEK